jgi:amino acid transporter
LTPQLPTRIFNRNRHHNALQQDTVSDKNSHNGKMGLWEAVSMAVGTMVGASIFSIFGVGAQIAKQDLPLAFLLSGVYAAIVAYSYAKLGTKIVSNAGPIAFILRGIGDNIVTGALSVLIWLTYVVSISLFARGFAGYFLPLVGAQAVPTAVSIVVVLVVVLFTVLTFFGSKAVGKTEFYIVAVKLLILGVFIALGISRIAPHRVAPAFDSTHMGGLIHASVIFFLSYMGFGLITNAGENMENPSKNIPRAIFISIAIVLFIYVGVSAVAVGNLSLDRLIKAQENALAIAAEPFLGSFGFLLISIGALFSISSALNATLYGGANIAYSLAKDGELPAFFERKVWFGSAEGLYATAVLGILFGLLFKMDGIAFITSGVFTVIYIFVLISHLRLVGEVSGSRFLIVCNLIVLTAVFVALLYFQLKSQKNAVYGMAAVFVGALVLEVIFRYVKQRSFRLPGKSQSQASSSGD